MIAPSEGLEMQGQPCPALFPKYPSAPPIVAPAAAATMYLIMVLVPERLSSERFPLYQAGAKNQSTTDAQKLLDTYASSHYNLMLRARLAVLSRYFA
jgi:hypothetical protein